MCLALIGMFRNEPWWRGIAEFLELMISRIQPSGSSYIYTAGLTLCMGTACLWGRARELELRITAHMDSTSYAKKETRKRSSSSAWTPPAMGLWWHLDPWAQRSPRLSLHEPCQFRYSFSVKPRGSVAKRKAHTRSAHLCKTSDMSVVIGRSAGNRG